MGYYTGSTSPREYTVAENHQKAKKGKIRSQKLTKSTKVGKNRPKIEKSAPQNKHFERLPRISVCLFTTHVLLLRSPGRLIQEGSVPQKLKIATFIFMSVPTLSAFMFKTVAKD
jgi:hypothetical protein